MANTRAKSKLYLGDVDIISGGGGRLYAIHRVEGSFTFSKLVMSCGLPNLEHTSGGGRSVN